MWTDGQVAVDADGHIHGLTQERKDRWKETAVDRQGVVSPQKARLTEAQPGLCCPWHTTGDTHQEARGRLGCRGRSMA